MQKQYEFMKKYHPDILKGDAPHIVFRFSRKFQLDYDKDIESQFSKYGITIWSNLKEKFPEAQVQKHYSAIDHKKLLKLQQRAQELDRVYKATNLFNYFKIDHPDFKTLLNIEKELKSVQDIIEYAYTYVPAPPPVVNATDDPRSVNQTYLNIAPGGIDARYAWGFTGGDGAGQRIVDIERGWTLNHEDISAHAIPIIHGTNLDADRFHGTSVFGQLCATDNTIGCIGIAPKILSAMASSFSGSTQANAILAAISSLDFGDVILLEAQNWVPEISMMLGPIELTDDVYEVIRLATALGIIVVEAGGNGTNNGSTPPFNLDTYVNFSGNAIFNPTGSGFRDSGAIIVTAATSTSPHTRLAYGPHGVRIDNYAWGQNINTLSSDALGNTTAYTTSFGGTSGASPMIAGSALLIQGIAQANLGYRFSARQMRAILRNPLTGTPPAPAETTLINVMPNLRAIIDNQLNLTPDIYIRDFVGDIGNPHLGAISVSPDVLVFNAAVANPQLSYGEGSGTENNDTLGSSVTGGTDNFIYVRVKNKGGTNATGVVATVYWSEVASLVTPDLWNFIGTTGTFDVVNGDQLVVSGSLLWPSINVPPTGHYCFVALIHHPLDPAPLQADFLNWNNFNNYIRENNNVTWRNFNVTPSSPSPDAKPEGFVVEEFLMVGAPDKVYAFDIHFENRLPQKSKVFLEIEKILFKRLYRFLEFEEIIENDKSYSVRLNPSGVKIFKGIKLDAKFRSKCRLLVHIPKEYRKKPYYIRLKQFYKQQQVGGITWRFQDLK